MANHEAVSDLLIRNSEVSKELSDMGSGFANDVADMVSGSGTPTIYSVNRPRKLTPNRRSILTPLASMIGRYWIAAR
jgi:hypothetical protein